MSYVVRQIKGHNPWLTRRMPNRHEVIVGAMVHATRSGSTDPDYDDLKGTENWANSPHNAQDGRSWGSYWDLLIGRATGERVVSTDWDHEYATWTAGYGNRGTWAAGIYYVQIEFAQARLDQPYTDVQIDSGARAVAELSKRYNFPIQRIPYLSQTGTPPKGICTHEDSANGRKLGKSDPGPLFPWDTFLRLARQYKAGEPEEADMTPEQVREIYHQEHRRDRNLLLQCAYAIAGIPRPYEGDALGEALAKVESIAAREAPLWDAVQAQNAILHDLRDAIERLEPGAAGLSQDERDALAGLIDQIGNKLRGDNA